jgi:uncharacterized linocin/CFP29 family protein
MTADNPQLPWTDEQWARVNQVIQEEASRARVAATFLPLVGPLPGDTDFVRREIIPAGAPLGILDREVTQLATLQVRVHVRGTQMADAELRSALALFRRAANVLARLEDAVVFRGLLPAAPPVTPPGGLGQLPAIYQIHGGQGTPGLWRPFPPAAWPSIPPFPAPDPWQWVPVQWTSVLDAGAGLVTAVSDAIGRLENYGHFGPFAVVLGQGLFLIAQTPDQNGYVLPQDRIIPFLGSGSLLRSSTLDEYQGYSGVVVALGGTPVELVVAADMSLQFLQVTEHPNFVFRVREKIALRIKEGGAIVRLYPQPGVTVPPPPPPAAVAPAAAASRPRPPRAAPAAAARAITRRRGPSTRRPPRRPVKAPE